MRREFPIDLRVVIIKRASKAGKTFCERCGIWVKSRRDWAIDHIISEGIRPEEDKRRKLVAADGQLLCLPCHGEKTPIDVGAIAEAKRREANHWGARAKAQRTRTKEPLKVAAGQPEIMRRFGGTDA